MYILEEIGSEESNYSINSGKYGDAVYETSVISSRSSWYDDYAAFPETRNPFFIRGGYIGTTKGSGMFCFNSSSGGSGSDLSFRPVLAVI